MKKTHQPDDEKIRIFLRNKCKKRSTRKKIVHYLGYEPKWNELFDQGVIQTVCGCPNHVELVD